MKKNDKYYEQVAGILNADNLDPLLSRLEKLGYGKDDISVLMTTETRERHFAEPRERTASDKAHEHTGELTAAIVGALAFIPAVGFLLAGPVMGLVAGGIAAAAVGGLIGFFRHSRASEEEIEAVERMLKQPGNVMVIAQVKYRDEQIVRELFERYSMARIPDRC